jgi:hypothetical protein
MEFAEVELLVKDTEACCLVNLELLADDVARNEGKLR